MNSSSINFLKNSNQTKLNDLYHSKLYWQEKNGNFLFIDILYISLLCPVSTVGVVLNLIALKIFSLKCFSTKNVYKYFKVYTINSMIICILFALNFLVKSPNILEFTNTYVSRLIALRMYFPVFAILYFYSSIMDIFISLERISHFTIKLKNIRNYNPYKVCFFLFLVSVAMNSTYIFVYVPGSVNIKLDDNSNYTVHKTVLSAYGKSPIGQLNIIVVYLIRDVFILLTVIVLNILSIVLLRRYLRERRELLNINEENILLMNSINTKLTIMVIVMLTISSLEHLIFFISYFYYFLCKYDLKISNIYNFISIIGIITKQISNFFIFCSFNRVFRAKLKHVLYVFFLNFNA